MSLRPDRGLTFLEVMVAISLMFLVSVFVMTMFGGGGYAASRMSIRTQTSEYAQEKMDEVMAAVPGSVSSSSGILPGGYSFAEDVQPWALDNRFKSIAVTVTSPDGFQSTCKAVKMGVPPDPAFVLANQLGCLSCHQIGSGPDNPATQSGPLWNQTNFAAAVAASGAPDLATYLTNSINNPDAYVVPGYTNPSTMTVPSSVTPAEVATLVNFLVNRAPP